LLKTLVVRVVDIVIPNEELHEDLRGMRQRYRQTIISGGMAKFF